MLVRREYFLSVVCVCFLVGDGLLSMSVKEEMG